MLNSTLELLVPSKLNTPQSRPFWVQRDRLLRRLAANDHTRLTIVVAPAGFGKSTLVAQWVQRMRSAQPAAGGIQPAPVAWLTLDEHDQDGLRFLTYLAGAVERVAPHSLPHTLPLLIAPEPPPLYLALQAFLVDLSALPCGITLILDDYHVVVAAEVHQVVGHLLRQLPHLCRLVIVSRIDPPLALSRLRAEGQLTEIRAIDLRFTSGETALLLTRLSNKAPAADLVSGLQQETEGWAIALQLAVLAQQEAGASDPAGGIARRHIAEYLAEEVFEQQPESIRAALLMLAVPERFCAELYAALHEPPADLIDAEELLGRLLRANLLLIPLDSEGRWYRFHHMLRDLLLRRLRLQVDAPTIKALTLRVAHWLDSAGLFEEAVRAYLAAGAESAAAEVVERLLLPALGRDQRTLPYDSWLRLLPAELIPQRPALLLLQARRATLTLDLDALATELQLLDNLLNVPDQAQRPPPWAGFPADRQALHGVLHFWNGRAAEAVAALHTALNQRPEPWVAVQTLMLLGQALTALDRRNEALQLADTFAVRSGHAAGAAAAGLCRCAIYMHAGELTALTQEADRLQQLALTADLDPAWRCYAQAFLAGAAYERSEQAVAAEYYRAVVQNKGQVSATTHMGSLVALVHIAIAAGDLERAADYEQAAWAFAAEVGGRFLRHQAAGAATRIALARGDTAAALRIADAIGSDIHLGMSLWTATPRLSRVRTLLAAGTPATLAAADAAVAECLHEAAALHNRPLLVHGLAMHACVRWAQHRRSEALAMVEQALEGANSGGLIWAFLDAGAPLAPLLQMLETQGRHSKAVQHILGYTGKQPNRSIPAAPAPHLPEVLTRREHEILVLLSERLTDKEIAEHLVIAPNTVRKHTGSIFGKLGVNGRREAVVVARTLGLLPDVR